MIDPSVKFSVTPIDGSKDLLGKTAAELQSGVTVDEDKNIITGNLLYVTGYEGFSSVVSEQEGNFLALNIAPAKSWPESLTVEVVGGKNGPKELGKNDPEVVLLIGASATGVKISAKSGSNTNVKTYKLNVTRATKA